MEMWNEATVIDSRFSVEFSWRNGNSSKLEIVHSVMSGPSYCYESQFLRITKTFRHIQLPLNRDALRRKQKVVAVFCAMLTDTDWYELEQSP